MPILRSYGNLWAEYASAIAFGWGEAAQYMGPILRIVPLVCSLVFALFMYDRIYHVRRSD